MPSAAPSAVRGAAAAWLAAAVLSGCAASQPAHPQSPSPSPSASGTATPLVPTPPQNAGPVPTGVQLGAPPVTYSTPPGFTLSLATDQELKLATASGIEQILFAVDPALEDTSHALGTTTVAGETGYILQRGDDGSGLYSEVVVLRHHAKQYELSCIGFHGYDASRIEQGCAAFTASLAFRA